MSELPCTCHPWEPGQMTCSICVVTRCLRIPLGRLEISHSMVVSLGEDYLASSLLLGLPTNCSRGHSRLLPC